MGMGWLRERLLQQTETVEEFTALLKNSRCTDLYNVNFWRANEYEKAKAAMARSGGQPFIGYGSTVPAVPATPAPVRATAGARRP